MKPLVKVLELVQHVRGGLDYHPWGFSHTWLKLFILHSLYYKGFWHYSKELPVVFFSEVQGMEPTYSNLAGLLNFLISFSYFPWTFLNTVGPRKVFIEFLAGQNLQWQMSSFHSTLPLWDYQKLSGWVRKIWILDINVEKYRVGRKWIVKVQWVYLFLFGIIPHCFHFKK